MSLVVRKRVFGVSDQVRHKRGCTATKDDYRLEISDPERRGIFTIRVAKTKALISFAATTKLICVFVFAYMQKADFLMTRLIWIVTMETDQIGQITRLS